MEFNLFNFQIGSMYLKLYFAVHCNPVAYERTSHCSHPFQMVSQQAKLKHNFRFVQSEYIRDFGFATNTIQNGVEEGCFRSFFAERTILTFAVCLLLGYYSMGFCSCFPANNSIFLVSSPSGELAASS